jgi:hypothetical protein
MATSLCFGLMGATGLILILVPVFYDIYQSIVGKTGGSAIEDAPDPTPQV